MKIRTRDQKIFCKLLGKLKHSKTDLFKNNISGERWDNHICDILNDITRDCQRSKIPLQIPLNLVPWMKK